MSKDWDALAHVRFLREGGGPSSGYTADLIERMALALRPFAKASEAFKEEEVYGLVIDPISGFESDLQVKHLRQACEFFDDN